MVYSRAEMGGSLEPKSSEKSLGNTMGHISNVLYATAFYKAQLYWAWWCS